MKDPQVIWKNSVDSTNDEVRRLKSGLSNLSSVAARHQSAGRGQGDHSWLSEDGFNLTFSMLLRFEGAALPVSRLHLINDFITTSIIAILSEEKVNAWVKLPNDIWVADKKICGILIENVLDGSFVRESIVGIGLNLNQTDWPECLPNPVSLKELTGKEYPPEEVLERISVVCKKNWNRYFMRSEVF